MIKNSLVILMLVIFYVSCHSDKELKLQSSKNSLGIGLIHFNLNESIPLFISDTSTIAFDTLQFSKKNSGFNQGKCIFKTKNLDEKLNPYFLFEGDSDADAKSHLRSGLIRFLPQLIFRVVKKTDKGVVVLLNEETKETIFIKIAFENDYRLHTKNGSNFFEPNFIDVPIDNWFYYEDWKQVMLRAWYVTYNNLDVYDLPNGKKITVSESLNQIDSVKGDWARVVERYDNNKNNFRWIKWNENDTLTIDITLNGGYD